LNGEGPLKKPCRKINPFVFLTFSLPERFYFLVLVSNTCSMTGSKQLWISMSRRLSGEASPAGAVMKWNYMQKNKDTG
jgi:hypothetical protein